jgi:hypothetical protein
VPTPEALSCVSFQYGIQNSGGYTAEDIMNQTNNTLKTGLLIATRNVTIGILNETFPRDGGDGGGGGDDDDDDDKSSERFLGNSETLQRDSHRSPETSEDQRASLLSRRSLTLRRREVRGTITGPAVSASHQWFHVMDLGRLPSDDSHPERIIKEGQSRRRTVYLPQRFPDYWDDGRRRLVYYTDAYLPTINSIVDNPFCVAPSDEVTCAVVDSTVCVILEEGDDEREVQNALLSGIEESIQDGSFAAAIPQADQVPGDAVV